MYYNRRGQKNNINFIICYEGYQKLQEEWEYIEDPTFSRSIGSFVCMTCSRFDYANQASCVNPLLQLTSKTYFSWTTFNTFMRVLKKKQTFVFIKNLIKIQKPHEKITLNYRENFKED